MEAWNISPLYQPPLPSASDNDGAIRYWEGWLDRGEKVGATGGSYTVTATALDINNNTTGVTITFTLTNRPTITPTTTNRAINAPTVLITGTRWNGWLFFGIKNQRARA